MNLLETRRRAARNLLAGCLLVLAVALVAVPAALAKGGAKALPDSGLANVGTVRCTASEACVVKPTPKQVAAKVAGKKVKARVVVPGFLGAGGQTKVKLRFNAGAMERLAGHSATFRGKVLVRGSGEKSSQSFQVTLKRPAAAPTSPGGSGPGGTGPGGNAGPNGEPPHSEPVSGEVPVLARPLTAKTVESVSLTWYPRDSWLRYVSSGTGAEDGVRASGGATSTSSKASACPDRQEGSDAELPYTIQFAPAESWFDPASGTADVLGTGSVSFRYKAHTINLTASEPEIQLTGSSSKAVFRMNGSEGTPYPNQRVALLGLDTAGQPTTSVSEGKTTYTYSLMRGKLTEDGEKVFAGFYTAPGNNEFGCISASFVVP